MASSVCRVFISFRIHEDDGAAETLWNALEDVGISAFLCGGTLVGGNIAADIANALDACELFVVLGTAEYGKQGDSSFSTREELEFAVDHSIPIFLIKRCDEFEDPLTRLSLPARMLYVRWDPGMRSLPIGLVDEVQAKLDAGPPAGAKQRRAPAAVDPRTAEQM
jgi:hypothetical protein